MDSKSVDRVDWSTMEAGRELDALVAERVMGWTRPPRGRVTWTAPEGYGTSFGAVPRYSTDIAAAWLVVEQTAALVVERDDYTFNHLTLCQLGIQAGWAASYDTIIDDYEWHEHVERYPRSARSETAPLAICRAALRALATTDQSTPVTPSTPIHDVPYQEDVG